MYSPKGGKGTGYGGTGGNGPNYGKAGKGKGGNGKGKGGKILGFGDGWIRWVMGHGSVGSEHTAAGAGFVGSIYQSSMAAWARSERRASIMAQYCSCPDTSVSAVDDAGSQRRRMGSVEPAESSKSASLGSSERRTTTRKWWI